MARVWMRVTAAVLAAAGLFAVFNPKVVLPAQMSWTGDFWTSDYGMLAKSFQTTGYILLVAGLLMLIVSFTTLVSRD